MAMIKTHIEDVIATVTMSRPEKRNAVFDDFIVELDDAFKSMPKEVCAIILTGSGGHFCAGLEIASATHVRIAEPSTVFQLPEGRRGIFVGGGATVRIGRILGADRMTEMMLTGRKYNAEDGVRLGLAHYNAVEGESMEIAKELAKKNRPKGATFQLSDNASIGAY